MARQLVKNGAVDCVLVIGFETMKPGPLTGGKSDQPSPMGLSMMMMAETRGIDGSPPNAQMFGNAGKEYMEK
jgi:sterol carrier protein 2